MTLSMSLNQFRLVSVKALELPEMDACPEYNFIQLFWPSWYRVAHPAAQVQNYRGRLSEF